MFADKDDDEDDKEDEVVADQSVIETFSVQRNLTPSNRFIVFETKLFEFVRQVGTEKVLLMIYGK